MVHGGRQDFKQYKLTARGQRSSAKPTNIPIGEYVERLQEYISISLGGMKTYLVSTYTPDQEPSDEELVKVRRRRHGVGRILGGVGGFEADVLPRMLAVRRHEHDHPAGPGREV
jgi:hypothetical protein